MKKLLFILTMLTFVFITCKKDIINPCDAGISDNLPKVTSDKYDFKDNKITITGKITHVGNKEGEGITSYGVCWSKTNNIPTVNDSIVDKGKTNSTGNIEVVFNNIQEGNYYYRCFATNCAGTAYGEVLNAKVEYLITVVPDSIPFVYVADDKNNDGFIEKNERVYFKLNLHNEGNTDAKNIKAVVIAGDNKSSDIQPDTIYYDNIPKGGASVYANSGTAPGTSSPYSFSVKLSDNISPNDNIPLEIKVITNGKENSVYENINIVSPDISFDYSLENTTGGDKYINKGDKIVFKTTIANNGTKPAKNISIEFKNSDSGIESIDPTDFGRSELKVGENYSKDIEVQLKNTISETTHEINVVIKDGDNNEYSVAPIKFTVGGAFVQEVSANETPEFTDTDGNSLINLDEQVTLKLKLKNTGSASGKNIKVEFTNSDYVTKINSDLISNLYVDATKDYSITMKVNANAPTGLVEIPIKIIEGMNSEHIFSDKIKIQVYAKDIPSIVKCSDQSQFKVISDGNGDNIINPGENITYQFAVKNIGTKPASNLKCNITTDQQGVEIINGNDINIGDVAVSSCQNASFTFKVTDYNLANKKIRFKLTSLQCSNCVAIADIEFDVNVGPVLCPNLEFEKYEITSGALKYNSTAEMQITINNTSSFEAKDINISFTSSDSDITISPPSATISSIAKKSSGTTNIALQVSANVKKDKTFSISMSISSLGGLCNDDIQVNNIEVLGQITVTDGLWTYYTFDTGNTNDEFGEHNAINHGVSFSDNTNSNKGKCAFFRGSEEDYISIVDMTGGVLDNESTVNFWIKTYYIKSEPLFYSGSSSGSDITLSDGKVSHGVNRAFEGDFDNMIADGQWHMLSVRYKSGKKSLFIDGDLVDEVSVSSTGWHTSTNFRIGSTTSSASMQYFDGYMDNIRIYSRALENNEIDKIYNSEGPAKTENYNNISVPKGCILYYDYNKTGSNLGKNSLGNWEDDFNATNNGVEYSTNSKDNTNCASFDGSGYFKINADILRQLNSLSISFWVKGNVINYNNLIASSNANDVNLFIRNNNLEFGASVFYDISNSVYNGNWNHIVIVNDKFNNSSNHKLYINGTLVSTSSNTFTAFYSTIFDLGKKAFSWADDFVGKLDNFRLYSRPLSKDEIQSIYNSEK